MDVFSFNKEDKVLFLGEGNFSFSSGVVRILKDSGIEDFSNFYTTCFEGEDKSQISTENKLYLKEQGVRVLYDIDATKLSSNPILVKKKFHKIIFNFPHVGGKMPIDLNRQLLKDFFVSASSEILTPNGLIFMSLCAGQGGTGFEKIHRRYDDTWQVTENASFGDFMLVKTENFPHEIFPNYVSTGFRSTIRSFHTEGSIVHVFKKCDKSLPDKITSQDINNLYKYHCIENIEVTLEYKNAICNNPLEKPSPHAFITKIIKDSVSHLKIVQLPLYIDINIGNSRPPCIHDKKNKFLRKTLYEVVQNENIITTGLIFNSIKNISDPTAEIELLIKSTDAQQIMDNITSIFIKKFNINVPFIQNSHDCFSINIDKLCSIIYKVDLHQLWFGNVENNIFSTPIVYPKIYEFDVSFGSTKPFDMTDFCIFLKRLPGNIIYSVKPVSVYYPENIEMTYFCYRITYKSYEYPLYRKRVIKYNTDIVCRALEKFFKVKIR